MCGIVFFFILLRFVLKARCIYDWIGPAAGTLGVPPRGWEVRLES